jgi:hypothetical protein
MEISKKEKTYNYSIWTRRPIYNCSRISIASRASLIPINRPLTFEEKHTSFEEESKATSRRFFLIFIFFLPLFIFCMYIILVYISCN